MPKPNNYKKSNNKSFVLSNDQIRHPEVRVSFPDGESRILSLKDAMHEATKAYANDLIRRVEDENDIEMTLDEAVDALTAFENRQQWTIAISDLLDKQEVELRIEHYTGTGNDRGNKDELKQTLVPLRKIMDI